MYLEICVETNQVGGVSGRDRTEVAVTSEESCRRMRGHPYALVQRDAHSLRYDPHLIHHAGRASRQRRAVREQTITLARSCAQSAEHELRTDWKPRACKRVADQSQAPGAF